MNHAPYASLSRRSALLSPLMVLARPAAAAGAIRGIPASRRIAFKVMRNGSDIGHHTLTFAGSGDAVDVTIDVETAVGVGPVKLYRYTMHGTETWRDGRFAGLTTKTNDNGTDHSVTITRTGDGLAVQSSGLPNRTLPGNAAPLTHWSMAALSGPVISPEDGQPVAGKITPLGVQTLTLPGGRSIKATEYDLAIHTPSKDWYDEESVWVQLTLSIRDGSTIQYVRE